MITENLSTLKIHKLTQEQYDRELISGNIDTNALYLTPEEEIDLTPYATIENVSSTYETKTDASAKLNEAKSYTDTALSNYSVVSHIHDEYMTITNPVGTGSFSMNRKADSTIGDYSHAEGYNTTASGNYSHAEGRDTTASGGYSHAEGRDTTASVGSHAEGYKTTASEVGAHAEGWNTTASGYSAHAEGYETTASGFSHAEGCNTTALSHQHVQGHYNNLTIDDKGDDEGTVGTAFIIGNGTSSSGSNAFRVTYAGKPYSCSSMTTSGADYAEFFEWLDLNRSDEDRRGYFVTLDEDKIKIAEPNDYILGIVSALPAVIGNGDECWRGRYILDDFGAFITEEFEYEEKIFDKESDEIKTITKTGTKYKENPDYDPTAIYIQREDRPEWDTVGMMGVLAVRDDGTCEVNGYCKVAEGGIATASETGYRVIKRVSNNVIKIVFK